MAQGAERVFLLPDDPVQDDPGQHGGDTGLLGLFLHSHAAVDDLAKGNGISQHGRLPRPLEMSLYCSDFQGW